MVDQIFYGTLAKVNQISDLIQAKVFDRLRKEDGAIGFEYLLIVGAVSVAVITALTVIGPGKIATAACSGIAGIPGGYFSTVSC
jgi:Flp pilus assembly pilin Flp